MPWRAVAVFVVTANALAWLVVLPLWLSAGLGNPLLTPLAFAMMATPTFAALVATLLLVRPLHPARLLGLVPLRPAKRLVGYSLLGFAAPQVIGALAVLTGAALGVAPLTVNADTGSMLALMQLLALLTAIPALGEELGWRGVPASRAPSPRHLAGAAGGRRRLGVWHAPLILLGYNYGRPNVPGVLLMSVRRHPAGDVAAARHGRRSVPARLGRLVDA